MRKIIIKHMLLCYHYILQMLLMNIGNEPFLMDSLILKTQQIVFGGKEVSN